MTKVPYTSRVLTCRACGFGKETAHMQLKMVKGYRGIVCPGCHLQSRVSKHHCQCKAIWHQCELHQHDLAVHRSAKPATRARPKGSKVHAHLSLHRAAPEAVQRRPTKRRRVDGTGEAQLHSHGVKRMSSEQLAPQLSASRQPRLAAKFPHLTAPEESAV